MQPDDRCKAASTKEHEDFFTLSRDFFSQAGNTISHMLESSTTGLEFARHVALAGLTGLAVGIGFASPLRGILELLDGSA